MLPDSEEDGPDSEDVPPELGDEQRTAHRRERVEHLSRLAEVQVRRVRIDGGRDRGPHVCDAREGPPLGQPPGSPPPASSKPGRSRSTSPSSQTLTKKGRDETVRPASATRSTREAKPQSMKTSSPDERIRAHVRPRASRLEPWSFSERSTEIARQLAREEGRSRCRVVPRELQQTHLVLHLNHENGSLVAAVVLDELHEPPERSQVEIATAERAERGGDGPVLHDAARMAIPVPGDPGRGVGRRAVHPRAEPEQDQPRSGSARRR